MTFSNEELSYMLSEEYWYLYMIREKELKSFDSNLHDIRLEIRRASKHTNEIPKWNWQSIKYFWADSSKLQKIGYKKDKWLYLILFYSYRIISKRIIPLPTTHSVNWSYPSLNVYHFRNWNMTMLVRQKQNHQKMEW